MKSTPIIVNKRIKPFVKWAGGKGQLLKEIQSTYPEQLGKKYTKYAEPFVGGGAVLFDILNKYDLESIYISDINKELITTYRAIRDNINELIALLSLMQNEYLPKGTPERKEYYYAIRDKYNSLIIDNIDDGLHCAAYFIFLNKTCFNGLYRVNRKGLFNVPMGAYKNPLICDKENLIGISQKLNRVKIECADYKKSSDFIDDKTFVYFDPPYRPLTDTASFTAYTENLFDDEAQRELAEYVDAVSKKGAMVVVSNSDPKNSNTKDDFFDTLYSSLNIKRVKANRMINCNSEARGRINELLIANF